MRSGVVRASGGARQLAMVAVLTLVAGCAGPNCRLDQDLLADRGSLLRNQGVAEEYHLACPDLLEITGPRLDPAWRAEVGADGRVDLGDGTRIPVQGRTTEGAAREIARVLDLPPRDVQVRVVEFRGQQVHLYGEVNGSQRPVPYQGPETVLDFLHRAGGIRPGAAPRDVYVVRPHIAGGRTPEIFQVDLAAILQQADHRSNVRLRPFDQVYVGCTRQSTVARCLPDWARPFYESLWGMHRPRRGRSDPLQAPASERPDLSDAEGSSTSQQAAAAR